MKITYHKHFEKELEKLEKRFQKEVEEQIILFQVDPFHETLNNHELHGKYEDHRSININWDLRAIYFPLSEDSIEFVKQAPQPAPQPARISFLPWQRLPYYLNQIQ